MNSSGCVQVNADDYENSEQLETIRSERGYNYKDVITVSPEKLPNYHDKVCIPDCMLEAYSQ